MPTDDSLPPAQEDDYDEEGFPRPVKGLKPMTSRDLIDAIHSRRVIDPLATAVQIDGPRFVVNLDDGRTLGVPIEWFPKLHNATPAQLRNCRVRREGREIEWPDLDEDLSVAGLLHGRDAYSTPDGRE